MKKILSIKIVNKKISNLLEKFNILGIIFCLLSFLFTYYYFKLYIFEIRNIALLLFQIGLSIKIGSIISGIIIQEAIKEQ